MKLENLLYNIDLNTFFVLIFVVLLRMILILT